MIKVALVRGKHLNQFEAQNYLPGKRIAFIAFSSLHPISSVFPFPHIKLPSLTDLPLPERLVKVVANRTLGDAQFLFGLESHAPYFDLFHTADSHYGYSYQLARLRAEKRIGILVSTSWETIPFNNESVSKKKAIKRFSQKHTDYFICYTDRAKNALLKEGVRPEQINLVRLGVDIERFKPAVDRKKKGFTILFVGRLVPEKGVIDLYRAFRSIYRKDMKLRIVGDGPLGSQIESMRENDHLEDVVYIESTNYSHIHKTYQEADLFVLPSRRTKTWEEQYGMVLIEAMASGLPVITYATGAIPEVVGNAGIVHREGDREGIINSLTRLYRDPKERLKRGTMGRKRAETFFDRLKTGRRLVQLYEMWYEKHNLHYPRKK